MRLVFKPSMDFVSAFEAPGYAVGLLHSEHVDKAAGLGRPAFSFWRCKCAEFSSLSAHAAFPLC